MNNSLSPNSTNQSVQEEPINKQRVFWASIIFTVVALISFVFSFFLIARTPVWQAYVISAITAVALAVDVFSVILVWRGRLEQGLKYLFWSTLFTVAPNALLVTSTTPFLIGIVLAVGAVHLFYLQPRSWRKHYQFAPVVASVLMALVEVFQPSFRLDVTGAGAGGASNYFGPFILAFLVISLIILIARQAWLQNNIRSRFLTFSLGLTLIAATVIAVVSVSSLLSAGKQAQDTSSQALRDQAQDTLVQQVIEFANQNDLILQGTSQDARDVAQQAAYILENPNAFNTEGFWRADDHMFLGESGQYMNSTRDVSTVFVPNTVQITDRFKKHLELLAYLDMALVPVYESDPNSVAIYFVGKDEISWLYPNINLGTIVPADYQATQDIFFTIGSPENNPEREVVWTPVYDDPGGQGLLVSAIAPVYTSRGTFMGIIGIDVSLAGLTTSIEQATLETGGYSLLLDADGRALALPEQGYLDFYGRERERGEFGSNFATSASPEFAPLLTEMLAGSTGFQNITVHNQELFIAYTTIKSTGWRVARVVNADQVLAPAAALETELGQLSSRLIFQRIVPIGITFIIIVVVAGIFFTNRLVNPLEQLTEAASKIGLGEWDTPLPKSEMREIDALSTTLSTMSVQLKNTLGTLEQRVADRTRNLELAAEVGRTVSQVRDLDIMLKDASDLILKEFNLYYVQVYLTDPSQTRLVLEAGTGNVGAELLGRGHNLQLNTGSINGRAAVEKRSVVISDTTQSATFRQNPLLPETRGEMAVPLIVADKVVGVLDMQSSEPGLLTEEILPAFEALAGQMAVAIQNAYLLAETEQARAQVEAQARRLVREGWSEHLDAIHKPEQIGFMFDRSQVTALADVEESQLPTNGHAVSAPISVTGESLGSLVVELDDEARAEQTSELVNIVARQVAQQIENLRLLESAERYRAESERTARLQTVEGWQSYISSRPEGSLGYLYDTKEVRPQDGGSKEDASTFALPLMVRDELIGKLSVQGLTNEDQESVALANTIAERLSTHIESLRLFEETKRGQVELDKRARQLAAVAEISSVSSKELDVQKMLESVVHLTQRKFGLYHAHVFIYNEDTDELKIRACGYKEGDEHEGTHGTSSIPLTQEQSLVARAARTRQAVIVNNVLLEPGWLPNPLLPDTASELAVPLVIGDRVLGVLDVQADHVNAFTEEDANIQTTLASQVATALQNARSFTQAQKQAEREAMLNVINQKIQSATSVEAVLQIAARELGTALGAPMTVAQLSMKDKSS